MIRLRKLIFLGIIALALTLFSCQQPGNDFNTIRTYQKLRILTTIAPIYSFTKNITGDVADVENLLPAGVGPHEYSMSPRDARKVAEAQLIIKNGINLESWLDKLISPSGETQKKVPAGTDPVIVDSSNGVEIINHDPHIWLSPKNAIIQVKNIRDALIKTDPQNSEVYLKNASGYIVRLGNLDREIREAVMLLERKEFVAFHSAFMYFAKDYGLVQAAVIQEIPEVEPSPGHIVDVINTIKRENINSIFSETGISHKIVESIAKDLNLPVYGLDTLETGQLSEEWYEERMRANLHIFKKALSGK